MLSRLKIINIMTRSINYDFSIQGIFREISFFVASYVECKIYGEINHFYEFVLIKRDFMAFIIDACLPS